MEFKETDLPGVGKKVSFINSDGLYTVLVLHHSGKRELYFLEDEDDDEPIFSTTFTSEETKELGVKLLGSRDEGVDEGQFEQLSLVRKKTLVDWVEVKKGSSIIGQSVDRAQKMVDDEVSIVAIFRGGECITKPNDEEKIEAKDTLMALGKKKVIEEFERICKG
ncbi:TrkA domain protein [Alkalibacillus filiformis]|uniref:TrkA domain protein n=1 Tax=Alkalibacillus filiformis TaxID=200990 RepID=A0ABU0DVS6_9BACI|nr:TrkA C-terminal domain-containing protein [Alkalibacillus filiformis]MDQ0352255.1 TrkA domain protein [Alkalibacillus filiformis]